MGLVRISHAISPPVLTAVLGRGRALLNDAVARRRTGQLDRLHLACGTNVMAGWANVDLEGPAAVIKLDLMRPLPLASGSMRYVYNEHFIEHIPRESAEQLLKECHRVLRPGGVFRVSTPDLATLVKEYASGRLGFWGDMHWTPDSPCRMLNEGMRWWGHQFLFDAPELERSLRGAGFSSIKAVAWRQSEHEALRGIECRPFHNELIYDCEK
jgi:predicted SAM-dependent methyltransferase